MSTETTCPCCGEVIDALVILEEHERCPNPQCRVDRWEMFDAGIDDADDDDDIDLQGFDDETERADGPTIVYPFDGPATVVD